MAEALGGLGQGEAQSPDAVQLVAHPARSGRYPPATRARTIPAVLLLALLAACGRGAGTDGPASPSPGPLVTLVRYGGIAGAHDRVSVDGAGVATVVGDRPPATRTVTLAAADLAALRTTLERSHITTLQRNYLDPKAADEYQYDVTYQGVTVTADEGVVPAALRPVVDQLVALLR